MEKTTVVGIGAGVACIIIAILWSGSSLMDYIDPSSIFITIGGTLCATIASYPGRMLKGLLDAIKVAFRPHKVDLHEDIEMIIRIANVARREGLLALEDAVNDINNPFFKKGVMLVVDGADPELIKSIMEAEIYFIQDRHSQSQAVFETMAQYAPAFGMVGTLIGLINMLLNLDDSASLGPNMSIALVTTFYGVVMANLLFLPMAKKLKTYTAEEAMEKELLLEGLLSIQDGENPRIIRDKLNSFIARRDVRDEDSVTGGRDESREISNG